MMCNHFVKQVCETGGQSRLSLVFSKHNDSNMFDSQKTQDCNICIQWMNGNY